MVINDGSTQDQYYSEKLPDKVKVINLETNQRNVLGYVSNEYVRNFGIKAAQGKYLVFWMMMIFGCLGSLKFKYHQ